MSKNIQEDIRNRLDDTIDNVISFLIQKRDELRAKWVERIDVSLWVECWYYDDYYACCDLEYKI